MFRAAFSPFSSSTNLYLKTFRDKYSEKDVMEVLHGLSNLKVLVVGEAIMDQYFYCQPMAKSPKETIVASRFLSEENFAGGVLVIANHQRSECQTSEQ